MCGLVAAKCCYSHGALSTERPVVRFRIAAVLQLSTPVSSRDRCSARRSPNERQHSVHLDPIRKSVFFAKLN